MRILTSDERRAIDAARNELLEGIDLDSIKPIIAISAAHRSGFITGLDHSAAQIAALTAENTRLREALKPFAKVAALELKNELAAGVSFDRLQELRSKIILPEE